MFQKPLVIRSKKIREAARGEQCTLRLEGCGHQDETVVFCHFSDGYGGMGTKPSDISGAFGCRNCHDIVDRTRRTRLDAAYLEMVKRTAMVETLHRLIQKGVITVKGAK